MQSLRYLSILFVFLTVACTDALPRGKQNLDEVAFVGLSGRVSSSSADGVAGRPIEGATVRLGSLTVTTDNLGRWRMDGVPAQAGAVAAIEVYHPRYMRSVIRVPVNRLAGRHLESALLPVAIHQEVRPADGGSLMLLGSSGGPALSVVLPPFSVDGTAETVAVTVSPVRTDKDAEWERFPGELIGTDETETNLIESHGMLHVDFWDEEGRLVDAKFSERPLVQMKLSAEDAERFQEGDTIPIWVLDDDGTWVGERDAVVYFSEGEAYAEWSVPHFSSWNLDRPIDDHACFALRLIGETEETRELLTNFALVLEGVGYAYRSPAATFDTTGLAAATAKRASSVRVSVNLIGSSRPAAILESILAQVLPDELELPDRSGSPFKDPDTDPETACHYLEIPVDIELGTVSGKVLDLFGAPVSGAVVTAVELGASVVSNADGAFSLSRVPWNETGDFSLRLDVTPPAGREGLDYETVPLTRDIADQTVFFVALPALVPPGFSHAAAEKTLVKRGAGVPFRVDITDEGALQVGLELCGQTETLAFEASATNEKALICHLPPGNPDQARTLAVGGDAVSAHLAHGDYTGPCEGDDVSAAPNFTRFPTGLPFGEPTSCGGAFEVLETVRSSDSSKPGVSLRGVWKAGDATGTQHLRVLAKNEVGYVGAAALRIFVENTPPVVGFGALPDFVFLGETLRLPLSVADGDGDTLGLTVRLNGAEACTMLPCELSAWSLGPNTVSAVVTDGEATATRTIVVYAVNEADGAAPDTFITASPGASGRASESVFEFASNETAATFECAIGSQPFAPCASPYVLAASLPGAYVFAVRAVDLAGNVDPSPAYHAWTVEAEWVGGSVSAVSCFLGGDTSLWCWHNEFGDKPDAPVNYGAGWAQVSGGAVNCGIKTDGSLWCWDAYNISNETWAAATEPTQSLGTDTDWKRVDITGHWGCALRLDDTLWCWGQNYYGQLGDGDIVARDYPGHVSTVGFVRSLSTTAYGICVVETTNDLLCWGNTNSILANANTPQLFGDPGVWQSVSLGTDGICAIRTDGTLWCATPADPTLSQVGTDTGWTHVTTAQDGRCGLRAGELWCWGSNYNGVLGVSTDDYPQTDLPVRVGTDNDWIGIDGDYELRCGWRSTGRLYCWGGMSFLQYPEELTVPTLVNEQTWTKVSRNGVHMCGINDINELYCWGGNSRGELGLGHLAHQNRPRQVGADKQWRDVVASGMDIGGTQSHSCALTTGNELYCMGRAGPNGSPVDVSYPTLASSTTDWSAIFSSTHDTCATKQDGNLWCWGSSFGIGQMDEGGGISPEPVSAGTVWTLVEGGQSHFCGIRDDQSLSCWGDNGHGQLGVGPGIYHSPTPVSEGTQWIDVSPSFFVTCGIQTDNSLWCWGKQQQGVLGNGIDTTDYQYTPLRIGPDNDWMRVGGGQGYVCAVKADGTLWCWGYNNGGSIQPPEYGQVVSVPTRVGTATNWAVPRPGEQHNCALKTDGSLWCWGFGMIFGQRGLGQSWWDTPVEVVRP